MSEAENTLEKESEKGINQADLISQDKSQESSTNQEAAEVDTKSVSKEANDIPREYDGNESKKEAEIEEEAIQKLDSVALQDNPETIPSEDAQETTTEDNNTDKESSALETQNDEVKPAQVSTDQGPDATEVIAQEIETNLDYKESHEYKADFENRQESFTAIHQHYLESNIEIRTFLLDYLQLMLQRKPDDVFDFTNKYFSPVSTTVGRNEIKKTEETKTVE